MAQNKLKQTRWTSTCFKDQVRRKCYEDTGRIFAAKSLKAANSCTSFSIVNDWLLSAAEQEHKLFRELHLPEQERS